jgi:glutathione synthase/RimK-type ligase-like ATP-grasp enzyme
LRNQPDHSEALVELAALALVSGHISAACTAYVQALLGNPHDALAHIGLANLLHAQGAYEAAGQHYEAALAAAPIQAHRGLAWVFEALGDEEQAEAHRRLGFTGHAIVSKPHRGHGAGTPLLLLVSARNGNIPVQTWIDDRQFAVTAIYTEYYDPAEALPPHALLVNAIGDADLCGQALDHAEAIAARSNAPIINPPSRIKLTTRAGNAERLRHLPGVITPKTQLLSRAKLLAAENLQFPLLIRSPGFHTGRHFTRIEDHSALAAAIAPMPGDELLAIQYLNTRGPDGMARKYRVMFVDGTAYPLHLAISADWKVHYFSAAMAANAEFRGEERQFLTNMPASLGPTAMSALDAINQALGLDYAGIDFALDPSGRILLFEANATMAVVAPDADPIWNYRRPAIQRVLDARVKMLGKRSTSFCEQKEAKKL